MAKKQTPTTVEVEDTTEEATPATIRPKDLAEKLEVNPKVLRGYLRKAFPRTTDEKNTSWALTEDMVNAATAHFTPSNDEDSPENEA